MRGGQASLRDALELLEQPLPEHADGSSIKPITFKREIFLCNLGFRYATDAPKVLLDLNLKISKGSRIGFIGTTGSGKSTLLDIVMGLLQPTEGSLIVDDEVITTENQRAWQVHIAHVPQDIFLADTSISENIAFGIPAEVINHARIRQVAQEAQIASMIESWDKQYNTRVGERGIRLSGGQRQRIGIARALYKQADVIVLDEATSALDNITERAVMGAIGSIKKDTTILIVAHRITTLSGCEQVVELENGAVKRIGSYDEIVGELSQSSLYDLKIKAP